MAAGWALVEYHEQGRLSADAMAKLDEIWETPGDLQATEAKQRFMRESFATLGIEHD
ncbi:MAG: hypothetical protein GX131_04550 [candidate division WS1 bacterium]|jgi:hypothetical protein|nr:hypothetical protein [candidate division WS1 bacterium]